MTQKIVDTNRELIKAAIEAFVAQEALARLGFEPKDVVRTPPEQTSVAPQAQVEAAPDSLQLTESEQKMFEYSRNRLYFLIDDDRYFDGLSKIKYKKSLSSLRIFYDRPNSGSLFDYWVQKDKAYVKFPVLGGNIISFQASKEFDDALLQSFKARAGDHKQNRDPAPTLRAIQGGQSD